MTRLLRFLGACPPEVGRYKTKVDGRWVCERCGS